MRTIISETIAYQYSELAAANDYEYDENGDMI